MAARRLAAMTDDATGDARFGDASEAMLAVTRLLESASGSSGSGAVADALVREARAFFGVSAAVLLPVEAEGQTSLLRGEAAASMARAAGVSGPVSSALALPIPVGGRTEHLLVLADSGDGLDVSIEELEVASAFVSATGAALAQHALAVESAARQARQASLMRAAHALIQSLDLNRVLGRICEEATRVLDADYASVFLGNAADGLRLEANYGLDAGLIGARVEAGEGLVGKVVERGEPMLTNDYQGLSRPIPLAPMARVKSGLAVPMRWDRELRGALAVGHFSRHTVTDDDLALLEAFADLAAAACRNASLHAGLKVAARTDALTGCLNQAALHDTLRRELDRCRRAGQRLSLAILDLDDFKQVNERHGHLAGDALLRRVGEALRHSVRAFDLVGRYGGDEFAIVAVGAAEGEAAEVASRAIAAVERVFDAAPQDGGGATAGVAEWRQDEDVTALVERADRALLYGKQVGGRGGAVRSSELPENFESATQARQPAAPAYDL